MPFDTDVINTYINKTNMMLTLINKLYIDYTGGRTTRYTTVIGVPVFVMPGKEKPTESPVVTYTLPDGTSTTIPPRYQGFTLTQKLQFNNIFFENNILKPPTISPFGAYPLVLNGDCILLNYSPATPVINDTLGSSFPISVPTNMTLLGINIDPFILAPYYEGSINIRIDFTGSVSSGKPSSDTFLSQVTSLTNNIQNLVIFNGESSLSFYNSSINIIIITNTNTNGTITLYTDSPCFIIMNQPGCPRLNIIYSAYKIPFCPPPPTIPLIDFTPPEKILNVPNILKLQGDTNRLTILGAIIVLLFIGSILGFLFYEFGLI